MMPNAVTSVRTRILFSCKRGQPGSPRAGWWSKVYGFHPLICKRLSVPGPLAATQMENP
jgi:hypothetical protein